MTTALSRTDGDIDTMTLGKVLAQSGYFQDARDAAQAIVKVLAGRELGIGPVAAMTGIYIVKGRVTLSANLIGAAIKRSGRYNYRVLQMDNEGCSIEFYEHGESIGISTFNKQDAAAAGLSGGDNWRKFPRNMFFARAMSNGAKWYTPDVFAGPIYTPDELGERVDGETGEPLDVTPPPPVEIIGPPQQTINANLRRKAEATPDQARAKFWDRFEGVLGSAEWSTVQRLTGTDKGEPVSVEGWREAWRAVDAALAAELDNAA
jgi:hypothetical protein